MPLTRLTLEERVRLVRFFSQYEKASNIQKAWIREFGTDPPSRKTIAAINKKFDETGSVADLTRTGRPKSSRTEEKIALVQDAIRSDPTKSIRILSNELGVNKASVHRIKQDTDKQGFLKLENKRLREKVTTLQRRIDILEGRKPSLKNAKKGRGNNIYLLSDFVDKEDDEDNKSVEPIPYVLSRTNDNQDSETNYELLRVEDEHGQTLSVEHGSRSTVITVLTDPDNAHHTFELTDGHEVHHLTIDANGQLREVDHEGGVEEEADDHSHPDESMNDELVEEEEINMADDDEIIVHKIETGESEFLLLDAQVHDENEEIEEHDISMEPELLGENEIPKYNVVEEIVEEGLVDSSIEIPICFLTTTNS